MWNISRIKQEARNSLKRFGYWMPLLVTFIYSLIVGGNKYFTGYASSSFVKTTPIGFSSYTYYNIEDLERLGKAFSSYANEIRNLVYEFFSDFMSNPFLVLSTSLIFISAFIVSLFLTVGWNVFVVAPFEVGKARYFMEHRAFETTISKFMWSFKSGRYLNIVKIMFLRYLKIWLWSLLFIIPGIIKSYQYRMIPYILAENPHITTERAFELTKQMTKGEKWHIFILDLSFIGWYLLGILCCCVGDFFLRPYIEAANAELYQVMREKAHGLAFSDFAELPGFFPEQA